MTGQTSVMVRPGGRESVAGRVRRVFPAPGPRAWVAAGVVLAAAGTLAKAFEAAAR